jgi:hypothetical protein
LFLEFSNIPKDKMWFNKEWKKIFDK